MKEKIKYGFIGFGRFSETTMLPAILKSPNSELIAIQKRSIEAARERAEAFNIPRAYSSVEELAANPDIDAVYIASPTCAHAEDAITSARNGKHVLVEKPMAMNIRQAEEMINVCRDNKVKLMVAHMPRFSPVNSRIKELIANNSIGELAYAKAEFFYDVRLSKRWWSRDTKIAGGGPIFDIGVHCLDTLRYILNDEVISTHSQSQPVLNENKTEMAAVLALKFLKGTPASIHASFRAPFTRIFLEVAGEDGIISAENFTLSNLTVPLKILKGRDGKITDTVIEEIVVPDLYEKELTHFSDSIIHNTLPMIPGEEGLKNQIVLDEAVRN